jgi:hypothetical protein
MIKTILSNELKKGDKIVMKGTMWQGTILDNKKGNIRLAEINGFHKDIGSIYVHDIGYAIIDNQRVLIELTKSQKDLEKMIANF